MKQRKRRSIVPYLSPHPRWLPPARSFKEVKHEDSTNTGRLDVHDIGLGSASSEGRSDAGGGLHVPGNQQRIRVAEADVLPNDIPRNQRLGPTMRMFDNDDIPWVKKLPNPPLDPLGPYFELMNLPISGSGLNAALTALQDQQDFEREYKRRNDVDSGAGYSMGSGVTGVVQGTTR
jgi:hypothetical protein